VLVFLRLGWLVDGGAFRVGAGLVLIGWGLYHWRFGARHRVRFGMQVRLAGLFVWSFLMATGHDAGLMLWPALMPLCLFSGSATIYLCVGCTCGTHRRIGNANANFDSASMS